ncbi:MAG: tetratricopeptide repeat protein [Ignavibacteria bacterium]|nr:tetratricopeptide repeat protein [Ignavibacteria bacterium]
MRTAFLGLVCFLLLTFPASAQEPDSARISIHQMESELHRWDALKTHPRVPELQQGAELARQGDLKGAIQAFQRAAPKRGSLAYFNLGVVYFETGELEKALRYFRLSHRASRDSVCLEYLRNTQRLINERKQQK